MRNADVRRRKRNRKRKKENRLLETEAPEMAAGIEAAFETSDDHMGLSEDEITMFAGGSETFDEAAFAFGGTGGFVPPFLDDGGLLESIEDPSGAMVLGDLAEDGEDGPDPSADETEGMAQLFSLKVGIIAALVFVALWRFAGLGPMISAVVAIGAAVFIGAVL